MLRINNLHKSFFTKKQEKEVLKGINLKVEKSDILAIVGESGCGKTTLCKIILGIHKNYKGEIIYKEENTKKTSYKKLHKECYYLVQNAMSSLDPKMTIYDSLYECYIIKNNKDNYLVEIKKYLREVKLDKYILYKFPHEISGGECQRICIIRALLLKSEFLICDEITSQLDKPNQNQILGILKELNNNKKVTIIYVTHDLNSIKNFCNKIAIMKNGKIVEQNNVEKIFDNPKSEYTKVLLQSILN